MPSHPISTSLPRFDLYDLLSGAQGIGLYDVLLPFLLVFAISFAILQKTNLFGTDAKKINVIVALILGLLFLQNAYLVYTLQRFLPNVSLILIVILMMLLLVGVLTGGTSEGIGMSAVNIAFILSAILVIIALGTDFVPGFTLWDWLYYLPAWVWVVLIAGIIIFVMARDNHPPRPKPN